jgi:hypothetical protein
MLSLHITMDKIERSHDFTEDEEELLLSAHTHQRRKSKRSPSVVTIVLVTVAILLPCAFYYVGYQVGRKNRPQLPTEGMEYNPNTIVEMTSLTKGNSHHSRRHDVPITIPRRRVRSRNG